MCKWNYDAAADGSGRGWDRTFLESTGFCEGELTPSVLGQIVAAPGDVIAGGLGERAAVEFGLPAGTPLAVGMIDAHAGGIGCLGAKLPGGLDGAQPPLTGRMALIAGTSTCHMASSALPTYVNGVWGPYYGAMIPGLYLNEGGQSAAGMCTANGPVVECALSLAHIATRVVLPRPLTPCALASRAGALLDHVVATHAASAELMVLAQSAGVPPAVHLNSVLEAMATAEGRGSVASLADDLHVTPDFIGNRSPVADPAMRGGIIGLGMGRGLHDLARLYLATVQALAYQTKAIVDALGYDAPPISAVIACGGLSKNTLCAHQPRSDHMLY